ncbi:MAG: ABC transporter permease [Anaerolineaceae bacterium]|nr:MAG: ABC transporter permease [Anaerolineaceae bacterium]
MQVFKTYFKIMKKQLASLVIYGIMFIAITLIITFAILRENSDDFTVSKVPVLLINNDGNNEFIDAFTSYLEGYVEYIDVEDSEGARKDALFYHELNYILTIPGGFTDGFLRGEEIMLSKEILPDKMEAVQSVDSAIDNYLNMARVYIKYNPGFGVSELTDFLKMNPVSEIEVIIDSGKKDTLNAAEFNFNYYNYLGYIMIVCFILGVSTVMMSFHGLEIRRRQFASPVSSRSFNLQLIFANLIFVLVYVVIFIIVGYVSNPFRQLDLSLILTWINALIFAGVVLCISYLVGITVKGKNAVQALSTALSLGLAFLSGMFVPQQFLGSAVVRVASFLPSYWYVRVNNTIGSLSNYSINNLTPIFQYMAIQIGFAAVFLAIILVVAKRKRQVAT